MGLPLGDVIEIMDESGVVMTKGGLNWVRHRAPSAFNDVQELEANTAVVRLGKWGVVPATLVSPEEREHVENRWTTTNNAPVTPFIEDYVNKGLSGGPWVKSKEAIALAACQHELDPTVFYKRLYQCMWANKRSIYEDCELNSDTTGELTDKRPKHEKLLDFAWKDSRCISLWQVDPMNGEKQLVNVPWRTCCVHYISKSAIENAAVTHLLLVMDKTSINTKENA